MIDGFGDANWVNSSKLIATTLRFWDGKIYEYTHVFIFCSMLPESQCFVGVPVASSNNIVSLHLLDRDKLEHISLIQLVTGIASKPWLSGNMLPTIKPCENGWSNFPENLRVVAIKFIELTQFVSPNLTISFCLCGFLVSCDWRRFSMHSPSIEKSMIVIFNHLAGIPNVALFVPPIVHCFGCNFFFYNNWSYKQVFQRRLMSRILEFYWINLIFWVFAVHGGHK